MTKKIRTLAAPAGPCPASVPEGPEGVGLWIDKVREHYLETGRGKLTVFGLVNLLVHAGRSDLITAVKESLDYEYEVERAVVVEMIRKTRARRSSEEYYPNDDRPESDPEEVPVGDHKEEDRPPHAPVEEGPAPVPEPDQVQSEPELRRLTPREKLEGLTQTQLLVWMGANGWERDRAKRVFEILGLNVNPNSLASRMGAGRTGRIKPPVLSQDQIDKLNSI